MLVKVLRSSDEKSSTHPRAYVSHLQATLNIVFFSSRCSEDTMSAN